MNAFSQRTDQEKAELWACLALRHTQGIGPRRASRLVREYGSAHAAVTAALHAPEEWTARRLLPEGPARECARQTWRDNAGAEWRAVRDNDLTFILYTDPLFPDLLRHVPDPPLVLYAQGDTSLLRSCSLAVVGSRRCSAEGLATCAHFAAGLSACGVTVISGMAKGIDRVAHIAALDGPGSTIGVLGTGIDTVYPACNADLYERVAARGLLLSEFPPGTGPSAQNFPVRNRLISGLSRGVLVVEAASRSGSLITARLALEQNRDVFAAPGPALAPGAQGCHELIRNGAKPVFTVEDILVDLAPLLRADLNARIAPQSDGSRSDPAPALSWEPERAPATTQSRSTPSEQSAQAARPAKNTPASRRPPKMPLVPGVPSRPMSLAEPAAQAVPLSSEERRILELLGQGAMQLDLLAESAGVDVARLSALLTMLEVRGLARRLPGGSYMAEDVSWGAQ